MTTILKNGRLISIVKEKIYEKIMISLFILVSMLGFAEGENEGSAIREVPI